jgi:hypothetical protein
LTTSGFWTGPETAQTVVWYLLARKSLLSDGNACGKAISITTEALALSFFTTFHAFSGLKIPSITPIP